MFAMLTNLKKKHTYIILSPFIFLILLTWNVEKALPNSCSQTKHMITRQAFVYFVVTTWEWILLTAAPMNLNFELARTAKIFVAIFTNVLTLKNVNINYQHLLTFFIFHNNHVYQRLLLFFGHLTHLCEKLCFWQCYAVYCGILVNSLQLVV